MYTNVCPTCMYSSAPPLWRKVLVGVAAVPGGPFIWRLRDPGDPPLVTHDPDPRLAQTTRREPGDFYGLNV